MGIRVWCSTRGQVKPSSALTMRMKAAIMLLLVLFPALAFVAGGVFTPTDGAKPSQEVKEVRNGVHTVQFGSGSQLARAIIPADNVEEGTTAEDTSKRVHLRNVRARRLHTVLSDGECNVVATIFKLAVSRRMGPSNDPARLPGRPIKLFIICANRGLRKVKRVGIRDALAAPRAAPANQHVIPFRIDHRRALKQLPQLQVPPLPFRLPSVSTISPPSSQLRSTPLTGPVPPLLFTPPLPQLEIPPLPLPLPTSPRRPPAPFLSVPTLPVTSSTPVIPLPDATGLPKQLTLPPLPPLPFRMPPLPCVPSSSSTSLPPP